MKQIRFIPLLCWLIWSSLSCFGQWQQQTISTDASFRGLCAVNAQVAWVSGTKGTFERTIDGGKTWEVGTVPDAGQLDFRDVEAFSETTAYLLSIGKGETSRIYKTIDGGKTWKLQFKNPEPEAFFDAFAFWGEKNGIAMSDPVKGQFHIISTEDGGNTWKPVWGITMPPALANEGGFAASGTCLFTFGLTNVWLVSGGAKSARVFMSSNRGRSWTVAETPIQAGIESAGIFSIAFRDLNNGIIVGGDYRKPNDSGFTAATTSDGGKIWKAIENKLPFQSGVAWSNGKWFTVGTAGSFSSSDHGTTWQQIDKENYNSVSFTKSGEGWAAGPNGRIAKFIK
ncbi:MAG: glycosyl hydrolase [Acidobacteria bacterium]|nr:glycosyl hydrolase [Acidobacteriota bacterium]